MHKKLSILGSTGSIGIQTLDVVSAFPDQFSVNALTAGTNIDLLKNQIEAFKPKLVAVKTSDLAQDLSDTLRSKAMSCEILVGESGYETVATLPDNDLVVSAMVGTAGLNPTYQALKKQIRVALACKEVLVAAGDLVMPLANTDDLILPIDSEHAAIHQCLLGSQNPKTDIHQLILTASGGPFRHTPLADFPTLGIQDALNHPNWTMGAKISIDSATMMNKGLELIEARHLFQVSYDQLDVVVHPQSIIHSIVEFIDGNLIAQLSLPDMRLPIQYALTYPDKKPSPWPRTRLTDLASLTFEQPDTQKFPLLNLAVEAGKMGQTAPLVLNAANEAAVGLFLDEKIGFTDISTIVQQAVHTYSHHPIHSITDVLELDAEIKQKVYHEHRSAVPSTT